MMTEDLRSAVDGRPDEPVDWESERRWNDRAWVQVGLIVLITSGVAIALNVALSVTLGHPNNGGIGGGLGAVIASWWNGRRVRRQIAEETGLSPWQVPIVGRWLRQGHIPRDPQARKAMAALVRKQQRALTKGRRWVLPAMMAAFAAGGVVSLVLEELALGIVLLLASALLIPALLTQRRNIERLPRIEKELAAPTGVSAPPVGS
ncbi:hypothetical protein [Streptomyces drozdowiczii]|uniref:Integral membrane protein n=1 Tax=Streptomyces drozdowiczii TaxID=202862 RepID=A0ABY6Q0N8_9ACTN|nr:hypothetical protein [Streptomyces drozdowiczii]UZK57971.1 hypothetical protein NEH16_31250 [Streptomyces drozdowiczii]